MSQGPGTTRKKSITSSGDTAANGRAQKEDDAPVYNGWFDSPKDGASLDEQSFPALKSDKQSDQQSQFGKFQEVKPVKKQWKKLYVFIISFDKQKGLLEKNTINLIINSLKDYIEYSFNEIKALTENNRLVKEEQTKESTCIVWRFCWTLKEDMYEEIMQLKEIKMRTAEIYFRRENRLDRRAKEVVPIKDGSRVAQAPGASSQGAYASSTGGNSNTYGSGSGNSNSGAVSNGAAQSTSQSKNLRTGGTTTAPSSASGNGSNYGSAQSGGQNYQNQYQKQKQAALEQQLQYQQQQQQQQQQQLLLQQQQELKLKKIQEKKQKLSALQSEIAEIKRQNEALKIDLEQIRERQKQKVQKAADINKMLRDLSQEHEALKKQTLEVKQ